MSPQHPALQHERLLEVVSSLYLEALVVVDGSALVKSETECGDKLTLRQQFSIHENVCSIPGQKKSAGARTGRDLCIPIFRQGTSQTESPEPAVVSEAAFVVQFYGERVAAARKHSPKVEIIPVGVSPGERTVASPGFDVAGTIEPDWDTFESRQALSRGNGVAGAGLRAGHPGEQRNCQENEQISIHRLASISCVLGGCRTAAQFDPQLVSVGGV